MEELPMNHDDLDTYWWLSLVTYYEKTNVDALKYWTHVLFKVSDILWNFMTCDLMILMIPKRPNQ